MGLSPAQVKVLDLLIRHEELTSQLYGMYAMKLSRNHAFWYAFALEKKEGAELLRTLTVMAFEGAGFDETRFDMDGLQRRLDTARARLNEVESKTLYPFIAVSTALEMESAMIDHHLFEPGDGEAGEVKAAMEMIKGKAKARVEKLKQEQAALDQDQDE